MIKKENKNEIRKARHRKLRTKIYGTSDKPRLNVYKSLNNIYAQLIDDSSGTTLVSSSTICKDIKGLKDKTKSEAAFLVGELLGKKAIKLKIKNVVFDRSGYLYTGRVKKLAEGARKAGLEF